MSSTTESQAFAQRLRFALEAGGVRLSPSVVANEFNLRYWGRSITPHTARNWLLGNSMPTQDKLRILAEWLQVSPDELRFGRLDEGHEARQSDELSGSLNIVDRETVSRYLGLDVNDRKTVREVVAALSAASTAKPKS